MRPVNNLKQEVEVLRQQIQQLKADNLSEAAARETWRRTANELQDRLTHVRSQAFAVAADIAAEQRGAFMRVTKQDRPSGIRTYSQACAHAATVIEAGIRALQ